MSALAPLFLKAAIQQTHPFADIHAIRLKLTVGATRDVVFALLREGGVSISGAIDWETNANQLR